MWRHRSCENRAAAHLLIATAALLGLVACNGTVSGQPDKSPLGWPEAGVDGANADGLNSDRIKTDSRPDPNAWPNTVSQANSDPWIPQHHDLIPEMHPKVLAINFINLPAVRSKFAANIQDVIAALKEGSRYHGYSDKSARPFLFYEVAKLVDLSDGATPPSGWNHLNSSKYPIKCQSGAPYQFDYSALFTQKFADYYGIADSQNPSRNLTLCELFSRGMVHEVWLHVDGDSDPYVCPNGVKMGDFQLMEVLESKQKYDAQGNALAGQFDPCAGNGCFWQEDFTAAKACGRSVRILYVNGTRGPGCATESLSHGWESTARNGALPYLKDNFQHFGNFDLDTRLGLPFDSWYACASDTCVTFTGQNSLNWNAAGKTGTVAQYNQGCGNAHFAPNSRGNYDISNPYGVLSTCEHFGLRDGPGGSDKQEIYTNAKSGLYSTVASDCTGPWLVYWRQSFPGFKNAATAANGKPMKNWWPYLFY